MPFLDNRQWPPAVITDQDLTDSRQRIIDLQAAWKKAQADYQAAQQRAHLAQVAEDQRHAQALALIAPLTQAASGLAFPANVAQSTLRDYQTFMVSVVEPHYLNQESFVPIEPVP